MSLTEFLLARIAEDEEMPDRDRILADCEAKRAIVNYFRVMRENAEQFEALRLSDADAVLTMLATAYSDHPDYRATWRS